MSIRSAGMERLADSDATSRSGVSQRRSGRYEFSETLEQTRTESPVGAAVASESRDETVARQHGAAGSDLKFEPLLPFATPFTIGNPNLEVAEREAKALAATIKPEPPPQPKAPVVPVQGIPDEIVSETPAMAPLPVPKVISVEFFPMQGAEKYGFSGYEISTNDFGGKAASPRITDMSLYLRYCGGSGQVAS